MKSTSPDVSQLVSVLLTNKGSILSSIWRVLNSRPLAKHHKTYSLQYNLAVNGTIWNSSVNIKVRPSASTAEELLILRLIDISVFHCCHSNGIQVCPVSSRLGLKDEARSVI